jgi:hypothetical protein
MAPPDCGAADGLVKDDMVIVEFSLGDDGAVINAAPVYTTRNREVALAFARAVKGWSWSAEDAKAVPPFFRAATRVELRCTISSGDRMDIYGPLHDAFWQWAGVPASLANAPDIEAKIVPVAQALTKSSNEKERIAGLAWLGEKTLVPADERVANIDTAMAIASKMGAPTSAMTYLAIGRQIAAQWNQRRFNVRAYSALLEQPAVLADATSATTLRLLLARDKGTRTQEAEALLDTVIADSRLPANDPLRVNALMEKAALASRRGDLTTAKASFDATGLTEQQCAVIGAPPAMKKAGASFADFPTEALRWGFEGWVKTEFDIKSDGRTASQRAIVAYPPFVFNSAATGIARDTIFQTTYRPETGAGCTGFQSNVIFNIPR